MGTNKSYTDIEQSKKLAEILPLETADMLYYCNKSNNTLISQCPFIRSFNEKDAFSYLYCWSLSALLGVLSNYYVETQEDGIELLCVCNGKFNVVTANNPVDACYEMILRLHELKML